MGTYWEPRWQRKLVAIESGHADYETFRKTGNLLGDGIVNRGDVSALMETVVREHVPEIRYLRDSLVGAPERKKRIGDVVVTRSSMEHAYMAASIAEVLNQGIREKGLYVLEVGGGYGGLFWSLMLRDDVKPMDMYVFVDDKVHLRVQSFFLQRVPFPDVLYHLEHDLADGSVAWPERAFIEAGKEDQLQDGWFDLAISTRALGEMDPPEVERCCRFFARVVRQGGIAYVVTWKKKVSGLSDLVFPSETWEPVIDRPWPGAIDPNPMVELAFRRK